jgi:filamin
MEAANAHQSWAEGPGLKGGKTGRTNPITIHAVDADGNAVPHGGDPFVVGIVGPEAVVPKIQDNGDGTYSVDYVVATPGEYEIDITLHGTPIKDSPFHVVIKPDVDASKCYAEGPGLERAFDNEVATFTIFARDGDDQPKTDGGDNFQLDINGPSEVSYNVQDNDDGTYTVTYEPLVAGDYSINVHLNGKSIKNAPFQISVLQGTDVSTSGFKLFTLTILTRDENNQARTFGGDSWDVAAQGPSNVHFKSRDNGDGTYTTEYLPETRGSYTLNIQFNGQELAVSPLHQHY